ncbi:Uncharacterised protein [Mycobacteroides abscessus subsp. abscessus]|nr:Uncharacterised protein [Mycobacteroides abscessus subsp. abscessus]
MLFIGHNHCAVRKLDLVARTPGHHFGRRDHSRGLTVGVQQLIADPNLAHGGPPGRRGQRRIERQRFTHTRPRRHDDHLPGVQPIGDLVQIGESRRHTLGDAAGRRDRIDLVHRGLQQLFQRHVVFRHPAVGDVVDLSLRPVHHLGHIGALGPRIAVLHHASSRLYQPAQQRLLRHDPGVVPRVGGGRHGGNQGVQIRRTAHPAQLPAPVQLGSHRHRIGGLTPAVEVEDGLVHALVIRAIEVMRP